MELIEVESEGLTASLSGIIDELPKVPKSIMDCWMPRLQAVAVVVSYDLLACHFEKLG